MIVVALDRGSRPLAADVVETCKRCSVDVFNGRLRHETVFLCQANNKYKV